MAKHISVYPSGRSQYRVDWIQHGRDTEAHSVFTETLEDALDVIAAMHPTIFGVDWTLIDREDDPSAFIFPIDAPVDHVAVMFTRILNR